MISLKYLKKKKEKVVVELNISKYNKTNFYIALVYNEKIGLYKVLYIPLDIVYDDINEYACYQFVDLLTVEYILKSLSKVEEYDGKRDFSNGTGMYNIEINMFLLDNYYQFKATQFVPKEWLFMFEMIVTLFEFSPHIVSELCEDMLTLFKDGSEEILYQEMFEFDLFRDDSEKLIKALGGGELLDFNKISYLEEVNGKYFSIISGHIVIISYNKCGIISTYCNCDDYVDYVYTVIEAIREEIVRKFSKIMVSNKETPDLVQYYLCCGINSKGIKVIHGCCEKILPVDLYKQGFIKFVYDEEKLEEKLK